jgi:LCP family protein required for cell wall assembly
MVDELRDALEQASVRGDAAGGEEVLRRAEAELQQRGRRTVRVVLGLATAAAVLVAAVVGGGYLYVRTKLDDIDRVDLATQLLGSAAPSEPMNVLLVGSDSRAELPPEDAPRFGSAADVGGARADTVMVLHVAPAAGTVTAVSLPRDLWLPIDGGAPQRLNTALVAGPGALVRTVQDALGIELDHYVQVDFEAFRQMVDALGGVTVRFDSPVRDRVSGLDIRAAGCRELDGDAALALVRSRHYQYLEGGRWRSDPTGDLGRISRQQAFLVSVLGDAVDSRDPRTVVKLLDAAADHVRIDGALSTDELVGLGRKVRGQVRFLDLPVRNARVGAAAVLESTPSELQAVGATLGQPAPAPGPGTTPSTRRVPSEVSCP